MAQAPAHKAARAIDLLFDSPVTTYIAASLHYLEAVPPIHYLKDDPPHGVYYI